MSIKFIKNQALLMYYEPEYSYDEVKRKLKQNDLTLKRTFHFTTKEVCSDNSDEYYEEGFIFKIGELHNQYYVLDKKVFDTEHQFYFSSSIKFELKHFVAYRNISIINKIDNLINTDIYIDDNFDESTGNTNGHLPFTIYQQLISTFPNSTELYKYTNARISRALNNYFDGLGDVNLDYESYLNHRICNYTVSPLPSWEFLRIELFESIYNKLTKMLEEAESYSERDWQIAIKDIICVIFPKYILAKREIIVGTDGRHKKKPDFLLVDSDGFVDILEIKKPNDQRLITRTMYRNNYVADRDLAGAIVQIEKYVYCLNHSGKKGEDDIQKHLIGELPEDISIHITNPQGILLMGRSNELTYEERFDLEIIKRQYRNIIDIMTYDDLLDRIKHILEHLKH